MSKSGNKKGPDFSDERAWGVILEDLRSQFRVFGEGLTDVRQHVEPIGDILLRLDTIESDVAMIKTAIPNFFTKVTDHERRITVLETAK